MRKAGGINLAHGVCDIQVSLLIRENAHRGLHNGISADPEAEIVVLLCLPSFLDPGEVIPSAA